jgi:formylmethanofuran dehydrogenase subunit B
MPLETINHVVCTGCALLCDDINVGVQLGTIQEVHNACLRGSKKIRFSSDKSRLKGAELRSGEDPSTAAPAEIDEAIGVAVGILREAKAPLICGGTKLPCEAQAVLLDLSGKLNAPIAVKGYTEHVEASKAIQDRGISTCTLGEAVNNADLLVFWGANPVDLGPKLLARTVFSRGRYRQSGKEVKKMATIDEYPTPTMERSDIRVEIPDGEFGACLQALVARLEQKGISLPPELAAETQDTSNIPPAIEDLADAMVNSEYCIVFVGEAVLNHQFLQGNPTFLDQLFGLLGALSTQVRIETIPMEYSTNRAGLFNEHVLRGSGPPIVDLHEAIEKDGPFDVILVIGEDIVSAVDRDLLEKIQGAKIVAVDVKRTPTTDLAVAVLPVAMSGIEAGGTMIRFDGAMLKLAPPIQKKEALKTDEEILQLLVEAFR